ncbi:hypothetical protein GCM10025886_01140 [Tetragenococcus halophilus subsp. flandriensis]|nr:hypothetical protein TEHD10_1721 [Tetragenococcus halophilus subsp. halophilus]GFK21222.1 hypothetical protein WJ7_06850 [Tetragenococcus halophilus]GMA06963.1 hypothetical protein GCM10025886_01140 [Tetragenococcus halophilus subsp. flandriensis]
MAVVRIKRYQREILSKIPKNIKKLRKLTVNVRLLYKYKENAYILEKENDEWKRQK